MCFPLFVSRSLYFTCSSLLSSPRSPLPFPPSFILIPLWLFSPLRVNTESHPVSPPPPPSPPSLCLFSLFFRRCPLLISRCGTSLQHLPHPQCHPAFHGRPVYSCQWVLQVTPQHHSQRRDLLCVCRWVFIERWHITVAELRYCLLQLLLWFMNKRLTKSPPKYIKLICYIFIPWLSRNFCYFHKSQGHGCLSGCL